MIYLLDTDSLIYLIRGLKVITPRTVGQAQLARAADQILNQCQTRQTGGDTIGLSTITVAELEFGARCSLDYNAESAAVRKVLAPFVIYDFDESCAEPYGVIRHELQTAGTTIGAMDLLIAAHAIALGATLVTNNVKEFSRLRELKLENWLE